MIAGEQARKAAERFLIATKPAGPPPIGEALRQLLQDCSDHLVGSQNMHPASGYELAVAAWADVAGRDTRCYVDLALSSGHLIWLVDPVAQTRHAIPVADLVRMLGPRKVAAVA